MFSVYYFSSGYNKLTDILLIDFFDSNLNAAIKETWILELRGFYNIPDILYTLASFNFSILNLFGPFLVYLSHLFAPLVLFDRKWVWKFALFYLCFHFITFGVGISFLGYVIVWFVVIPWKASFSPSKIEKST